MFGNPETTTGGLALKFYSSVRMDIRKIETLKHADVITGARIRVKIVKNKVAPPYRQAEFEMVNGQGISKEGSILDMAVETGIIDKSGSWFLYKTTRIGQGRENAKAYLKTNPEISEEIMEELRKRLLLSSGDGEEKDSKANPAKDGDAPEEENE